MDKNYTMDCLEGYAMLTSPDATRTDTGVCTLDDDVPSVKWVYDNDQDSAEECVGRLFCLFDI